MQSAQHCTCSVPVFVVSEHPPFLLLLQHFVKVSTTSVGVGSEDVQSKSASAAHISVQLSGVPIEVLGSSAGVPRLLGLAAAGVPRLLASSQSFFTLGVSAWHDPATIPVFGSPAQFRKYPTLLVVGFGFGIPLSGPAHAAQQASGVANVSLSISLISLQTAKQQPCMFCIVDL